MVWMLEIVKNGLILKMGQFHIMKKKLNIGMSGGKTQIQMTQMQMQLTIKIALQVTNIGVACIVISGLLTFIIGKINIFKSQDLSLGFLLWR